MGDEAARPLKAKGLLSPAACAVNICGLHLRCCSSGGLVAKLDLGGREAMSPPTLKELADEMAATVIRRTCREQQTPPEAGGTWAAAVGTGATGSVDTKLAQSSTHM